MSKPKFTRWSVCSDEPALIVPHPHPAPMHQFAHTDWIDCNIEENAHLFAAAPEMYEAGEEALAALYGAREALGDVANISHAIRLLEAAQDKARGEAGK